MQFLSASQAAELFGITRPTIYRQVLAGALPAVRVGGSIRIPAGPLVETRSCGRRRTVNDPSPWNVHVACMLETFGRRNPECVWCGATVYMALQGFFSGGVWTTEEVDEGPCSGCLDGPGTRCAGAPDGERSCFATQAWLDGDPTFAD